MEKIDGSIEVMEGRDSRSTKMELNRRKIDEIVEWINAHQDWHGCQAGGSMTQKEKGEI